jgi:hypothetical protein
MKIYTQETFYNDEFAEVIVLTERDTREEKYLVSIKFPTPMGMIDTKLPIKAYTLEEAFNKIDETIREFEQKIISKKNQAKLMVPPSISQQSQITLG